jgi:hypothetical protein
MKFYMAGSDSEGPRRRDDDQYTYKKKYPSFPTLILPKVIPQGQLLLIP